MRSLARPVPPLLALLLLLGLLSGLSACGSPSGGTADPGPGLQRDLASVPARDPSLRLPPYPLAPDFHGRVVVVGDLPGLPADPEPEEHVEGCPREHLGPDPASRSVRLDDEGGLADVVVQLVPIGRDHPADAPARRAEQAAREPVRHTLAVHCCRLEPRVLVVLEGDEVEFAVVEAGVRHVVHTWPRRNEATNRTVSGDTPFAVTYDHAEAFRVACDVHPCVCADVVVVDEPLHTLTDAEGRFRFPDVPAGAYRLELWHARLGQLRRRIEVPALPADAAERASFELELDARQDLVRPRR